MRPATGGVGAAEGGGGSAASGVGGSGGGVVDGSDGATDVTGDASDAETGVGDGATDATGETSDAAGEADAADAGSMCQGLDESQCVATGVPCVALKGKQVQDGGTGYAGCWTGYWLTADGGWYPKDFAAIQSCGIDASGWCWVFSGAFVPDGWQLLVSCNNVPACAGVFGDG